MDETMLTLKTGVKLIERDGKIGLALNGHVRYAENEQQAEILLTLVEQPQPLESLTALLRVGDGLQNNNENSLAIAEFILDFGEYLEA